MDSIASNDYNGVVSHVIHISMENNPLKRVLKKISRPGDRGPAGGASDLRVAAVKDVTEDKPYCAKVGGKDLAVFKSEGKYYALANACSHAGGPLCQGRIEGGAVVCPWHGSKFSLKSGEAVHGPAVEGVDAFELEVRGDDLYLKKP